MSYIIAVDFDGTIIEEGRFPDVGKVNKVVVRYILDRQQHGAKLILWTNREGEALKKAVGFCKHLGIVFDAVNENLPETLDWMQDSRKIFAHEYLDDRNVHLSQLKGFFADNEPYLVEVEDVEKIIEERYAKAKQAEAEKEELAVHLEACKTSTVPNWVGYLMIGAALGVVLYAFTALVRLYLMVA